MDNKKQNFNKKSNNTKEKQSDKFDWKRAVKQVLYG